ncbi:metal-dependent hydrolase [Candidatus Aerophobetes bacterium]|uniref:Metal-dependent hydrolase n=1 Tax=Aerophobetes bacterium TaxID=2030807 RepID=A0A523UZ20_UNCAE|nr:MAG: metal-dependent hydrolase [Candidatus Aerophobetes bacterium]
MPDWLVHLGFAYVMARLIKLRDLKLFFLGSLLPDISRVALYFTDFAHLDQISSHLYFMPFHTPFMAALVALVISLFSENFKKCFFLIFLGAIFHLALDLTQYRIGNGVLLFYPFSFRQFYFSLFWSGDNISVLLRALAIGVLVICLLKKRPVGSPLFLRAPNLKIAFPLMVLVLIIPLSTTSLMMKNNVDYVDFLAHPQKWEGKRVEFYNAKVISTNPVIVRGMGVKFEVVTSEEFREGDQICIRATHKEGRIFPVFIYRYRGPSKSKVSLVGLLLFVLIWIDFPQRGRVRLIFREAFFRRKDELKRRGS